MEFKSNKQRALNAFRLVSQRCRPFIRLYSLYNAAVNGTLEMIDRFRDEWRDVIKKYKEGITANTMQEVFDMVGPVKNSDVLKTFPEHLQTLLKNVSDLEYERLEWDKAIDEGVVVLKDAMQNRETFDARYDEAMQSVKQHRQKKIDVVSQKYQEEKYEYYTLYNKYQLALSSYTTDDVEYYQIIRAMRTIEKRLRKLDYYGEQLMKQINQEYERERSELKAKKTPMQMNLDEKVRKARNAVDLSAKLATKIMGKQKVIINEYSSLLANLNEAKAITTSLAADLIKYLEEPSVTNEEWDKIHVKEWAPEVSELDMRNLTVRKMITPEHWLEESTSRMKDRAETFGFARKYANLKTRYQTHAISKTDFLGQVRAWYSGFYQTAKSYQYKTGLIADVPTIDEAMRDSTKYAQLVDLLPSRGYMDFMIVNESDRDTFDAFMMQSKVIPERHREIMIERLEHLADIIDQNDGNKTVKWYNRCKFVIKYNSDTHGDLGSLADRMGGTANYYVRYRSVNADEVVEHIRIAITLLQEEEPNIDLLMGVNAAHSIGSDTQVRYSDVDLFYMNPFQMYPCYLFSSIPRAGKKANKKQIHSVTIETLSCEDGECIYKAFLLGAPGLAKVPQDELEALRLRLIVFWRENSERVIRGLRKTNELGAVFKELLREISVPFIIVTAAKADNSWRVVMNHKVAVLKPEEFALHMENVIGLYIYRGHMYRITGISYKTDMAWSYSLVNGLVRASHRSFTAIGDDVLQLVAGNERFIISSLPTLDINQDVLDCWKDREMAVMESLISEWVRSRSDRYMMKYLLQHKGNSNPFGSVESDVEDLYDDFDSDDDNTEDTGNIPLMEDEELLVLLREELEANKELPIAERRWPVRLEHHIPILVFLEGDQIKSKYGEWELTEVLQNLETFILIERYKEEPPKWELNAAYKWKYARIIDFVSTRDVDDGEEEDTIRDSLALTRLKDHSLVDQIAHFYNDKLTAEQLESLAGTDSEVIQKLCQLDMETRVVVINGTSIEEGRLRVSRVAEKGTITQGEILWSEPSEKYPEAPDLIRLWQDPDGSYWNITMKLPYSCPNVMRELKDKQTPIYGAFDVETVNIEDNTEVVVVSFTAIKDDEPIEVHAFTSETSMKTFIVALERLLLSETRPIIMVSFNGVLFDMHFVYKALGQYAAFFSHTEDSVCVVGNRIMEIVWRGRIRFIDVRRFTGLSLAKVCKGLQVETTKAHANHEKVQALHKMFGYKFQAFKTHLSSCPYNEVLLDVEKCDQSFQDAVRDMNGFDAYVHYCKIDTKATLECYLKLRKTLIECVDFIRHTTEISSWLVSNGRMTMDEIANELAMLHNPDFTCTGPALAYKVASKAGKLFPLVFKTSVGNQDLCRGVMPKAKTYELDSFIRESLYGGTSVVWDVKGQPGIIDEDHAALDQKSMYPNAAMRVSMPVVLSGSKRLAKLSEPVHIKCFNNIEEVIEQCDGRWKPTSAVLRRLIKQRFRYVQRALDATGCPDVPLNKHGVYRCLVVRQPNYVSIPYRRKDRPLNWKYHGTFVATLNRVAIDNARMFGAEIVVLEGWYYPFTSHPGINEETLTLSSREDSPELVAAIEEELAQLVKQADNESLDPAYLCNPLFMGSLMIWRVGKMQQDRMIAERGVLSKIDNPTPEQIARMKELKENISDSKRFVFKFLSNSVLGKYAQRIREIKNKGCYGAAEIQEVMNEMIDESVKSIAVQHLLDGDNPLNTAPKIPTGATSKADAILKKLLYPYNGPAMVTYSVEPESIFENELDEIKEVIISSTMLAFSHMSMDQSILDKAWRYSALRATETDGAHMNVASYLECMAIEDPNTNPFWVDGPLRKARTALGRGLKASYESYALGIGDVTTAAYQSSLYFNCSAIGDFRVNQMLAGRILGAKTVQPDRYFIEEDYGFFDFEEFNHQRCEVSFPFPKFYYVALLNDAGKRTKVITRCKGIGKGTRDGEDLVRWECEYAIEEVKQLKLWKSTEGQAAKQRSLQEYKAAKTRFLRKQSSIRHELSSEFFDRAPVLTELVPGATDASDPDNLVIKRDVYHKLTTGYAIDIVDWRFEGSLTASYADENYSIASQYIPENHEHEYPITHRFTTKRISPHPFFRLLFKDRTKQSRDDYLSSTSSLNTGDKYDERTTEIRCFNGERPRDDELQAIKKECCDIVKNKLYYKRRGFTFESAPAFDNGTPRNIYVGPIQIGYIIKYL